MHQASSPAETDARVRTARDFAVSAHGAQQYGHEAYVVHLDAVAEVLARHGYSHEREPAYLHDVLEDTGITIAELERRFGKEVAHIVRFCTDEPGDTRALKKKATYERMRHDIAQSASWVTRAIRVKVADRLANVQASRLANATMMNRYRAEANDFRKALYRPGDCDTMWSTLDALMG